MSWFLAIKNGTLAAADPQQRSFRTICNLGTYSSGIRQSGRLQSRGGYRHGKLQSGRSQSGRLQSRATRFGIGDVFTCLGGYRPGKLQSGMPQSGRLQSRATRFGTVVVLTDPEKQCIGPFSVNVV